MNGQATADHIAEEEPAFTPAPPPANRMILAVMALIGVVIAAYMALYKLGAIASIACGTGACEVVQSSPWAVFLGVPVPVWGVAGYATILALAIAGLQPRFTRDRRIGAALLALTTFAFGFSVYLSWVEAVLIQAWCRWCIGSALVATALFLAALPELPRLRTGRAAS